MRERVKRYLEDLKTTNLERKKQILRELAACPQKTLPILGEVFQRHEKLLLGSAARVIKEIGYPQNASTIPWLVGVCTDANLLQGSFIDATTT